MCGWRGAAAFGAAMICAWILPLTEASAETIGDEFVQIQPPSGSGWTRKDLGGGPAVFGKAGRGRFETFIVQAGLFPLPPNMKDEDFAGFLTKELEAQAPGESFETIVWRIEPDASRSYFCLRVLSVVRDTRPGLVQRTGTPLISEMSALYCRHPKTQEAVLFAIYSHRGLARYEMLEADADAFFIGVQVPGFEPSP